MWNVPEKPKMLLPPPQRKEIPPPWKPVLANEIDTSYFNKKYTHADIDEATPPVCRVIQMTLEWSTFDDNLSNSIIL